MLSTAQNLKSTQARHAPLSPNLEEELPLGWQWCDVACPRLGHVSLSGGISWIYEADIPSEYSLSEVLRYLDSRFPNGWCARGCTARLLHSLSSYKHHHYSMGSSAELSLDKALPQSVHILARRAARTLSVREVFIQKEAVEIAHDLYQRSRYARLPRLRYLFREQPRDSDRVFCASTKDSKIPQALVTLTQHSADAWHTELLLRANHAPIGSMELLICESIRAIRKNDARRLSLGEVPFYPKNAIDFSEAGVNTTLYSAISTSLPSLLAPSFNTLGLYSFKNKFAPQWEAVFWISTRRFRLRDMFLVGVKSNCLKLIFFNLIRKTSLSLRSLVSTYRLGSPLRARIQ